MVQAKEIMYHKANLNRIMSECTGQPIEKVWLAFRSGFCISHVMFSGAPLWLKIGHRVAHDERSELQ